MKVIDIKNYDKHSSVDDSDSSCRHFSQSLHFYGPAKPVIYKYSLLLLLLSGSEAGIQLPLMRLPDSSVFSLMQTGWCGRASHHQNLAPIPMGE